MGYFRTKTIDSKGSNYLLSVDNKNLSEKYNYQYKEILLQSYLKLIIDGVFNLNYNTENIQHQGLINNVLNRSVFKIKTGFKYYTFYEYLLNCFTQASEINGTFIFNKNKGLPVPNTNIFLGISTGYYGKETSLQFTADYTDLIYTIIPLKTTIDRLTEHFKTEEYLIQKGSRLIFTNKHNEDNKGMDDNFQKLIQEDLKEFTNSNSTDITFVYPDYIIAWLDRPESLRPDYMEIEYNKIMNNISSILQIPMTRLIGKSPDGMNATGEGDDKNYQDTCINYANIYIKPMLKRIIFLVYNKDIEIEITAKEIFQNDI